MIDLKWLEILGRLWNIEVIADSARFIERGPDAGVQRGFGSWGRN